MDANAESFLLSIAEISLAFVGFSAIVSVLARNKDASESAYQGLLVDTMVEFGFAALLLALLPLVITFFGINDVWVARLSNTAMCVFVFSYFPSYQIRRKHAIKKRNRTRTNSLFYIRISITYAIGLLVLLSGWRSLPKQAFAIYVVGIVWLIFLAALGFLLTIRKSRK